MSVKRRILSIRLIEKVRDYPEYAEEIGLSGNTIKKDKVSSEKENKGEKNG